MKRLFAILLIVAFIVSMTFVFASCGGNSDDTDTDTNTNIEKPAEDIDSSTDTASETETGDASDSESDSDEDSNSDEDTSSDTEGDEPEIIIYTVYVENQFGAPVEGVGLQICNDSFCLTSKVTDAEGKAVFEIDIVDKYKVQINTVPDGFVMPKENKVPFPDGKTTVMVTIEQNETYVINASDLHGKKLSGILVELLNEKMEVVESIITEADGIAEFVVSPGTYYARAKHSEDNGAYKLITLEGEEYFDFKDSKTKSIQFTVVETDIPYTLNVNDSNGAKADVKISLYNKDLDLLDEQTTDANGTVEFLVPNGSYYAVATVDGGYYANYVEFTKDSTTTGEIVVTEEIAGSDRLYPIFATDLIEVTLASGEFAWYFIPDAQGKVIEIDSDTANIHYITLKEPVDGKLKVTLKSGAVVKLMTTLTEGEENISAKVYLPGSQKTPYEIDVNEIGESYNIEVKVSENGAVYYSFVADDDGTVKVSTATEYAYITINGNPNKKSVKVGDTVLICFSSLKASESTTEYPAVDINATITFAQTSANYSVSALIENEVANGTAIELYQLVGEEYKIVKDATCDENGAYTFENLTETADYYIKAICPEGYETQKEYIPFGDANELVVHINHERDGSADYPYLVNEGEGLSSTTEIAVEAGESVCYTMFDIEGAIISIDNANAKLEIIIGEETVEILTGEVLSYVLTKGENQSSNTNTRIILRVSMVDSSTSGIVNLTIVAPEIAE